MSHHKNQIDAAVTTASSGWNKLTDKKMDEKIRPFPHHSFIAQPQHHWSKPAFCICTYFLLSPLLHPRIFYFY